MNTKKKVLLVLAVLLIIVSGVGYSYYKKAKNVTVDPNIVVQNEVAELVAKVGKLIILPVDEVPTVATVNDPEKLKDQAFFAKAKVGDKVLFFTNAKKAYLYDPVANKILEIAPINLGSTATPPAPAAKTTTTTKTNKTQYLLWKPILLLWITQTQTS